jgi:hypothetical protein
MVLPQVQSNEHMDLRTSPFQKQMFSELRAGSADSFARFLEVRALGSEMGVIPLEAFQNSVKGYLNPLVRSRDASGVDQFVFVCRESWSSPKSGSKVQAMSHTLLPFNLTRDFRYAVWSLGQDLRFTFVAVFALTLGSCRT